MENRTVIIKASAGTGKTFTLATQIIRLLKSGIKPHEIIALTFSRNAAAEIYDKLVARLAEAAASEKNAEEESKRVCDDGKSTISTTEFSDMLRSLIATQYMSHIGTIDSFMMQIVIAFPLELGLQASVGMMNQYQEVSAKNRICNQILSGSVTNEAAENFMEALKLAQNDESSRSYSHALIKFINLCFDRIQHFPNSAMWGEAKTIFGGNSPFREIENRDGKITQLAEVLTRNGVNEKAIKKTIDFFRNFNYSLSDCGSFLEKVFDDFSLQRPSSISVSYNRKVYLLDGADATLIFDLTEDCFAKILNLKMKVMRGIFGVMKLVEEEYNRNVRMQGHMVFNDIPRMIARIDTLTKQNLEYRFGSKFKYWALDEFQDTSHEQWNVIQNLVDEKIQDDVSNAMFVVGDIKQSIYGWRNSDMEIFNGLCSKYSQTVQTLATSYRYGPEIAEAVNKVFNGESFEAVLSGVENNIASPAVSYWKKEWKNHKSERPSGAIRIEEVRKKDGVNETQLTPYIEKILKELNEVRPWERNMTCAILVRGNDNGERICEELRQNGIPATYEGESEICDTPVIIAFLSLLQLVEHPADKFALKHISFTPLWRTLEKMFGKNLNANQITMEISKSIAVNGFAKTLQLLVSGLPDETLDDFTKNRLTEFLNAAVEFEAFSDIGTALGDFQKYLENRKKRDIANASSVKILTIHRSKGLGFDFVILPLIETRGLLGLQTDFLASPDKSWILQKPDKRICEKSQELNIAYANELNKNLIETFCVYYVAMTRALKRMTVLIKAEGSKSDTVYFSDFIRHALNLSPEQPYEAGNFKLEEIEEITERNKPGNVVKFDEHDRQAVRRNLREEVSRFTPSEYALTGISASRLFDETISSSAAERGTELHKQMQQIDWLDDNLVQPENVSKDVLDLTRSSEFRTALLKKSTVCDLWKERSFEVISENRWISGCIDRVVFFKIAGQLSANIYDYKTNAKFDIETDAEFCERMKKIHKKQMSTYKSALMSLTGIPEDRINCFLLLTENRCCCEI